MTTIVASRPPARDTNRLRITRSRNLSSAPPMMMTVPSVTDSRRLRSFAEGYMATPPALDSRAPGRADRVERRCLNRGVPQSGGDDEKLGTRRRDRAQVAGGRESAPPAGEGV